MWQRPAMPAFQFMENMETIPGTHGEVVKDNANNSYTDNMQSAPMQKSDHLFMI